MRDQASLDGPPPQLSTERRFHRRVWFVLIAVSTAVCIWYVAARLTDLMITVAICFFLAFAMEPAVNRLAARGWRRGIATMVIYVGGIIAIAGFLAAFGSLLFEQFVGLFSTLPNVYADVQAWVDNTFHVVLMDPEDLAQEYLADAVGSLAGSALAVVGGLFTFIFGALTVLLVTFYLVADGPRFRRTVCSYLPQQRQREVLAVWEVAIDKTSSYIVSRSILALVCGVATTIFLLVIKVDYALALGAFTGIVAAFIPTVGTYIAGAVPVLVAFSQSTWQGVATLAFILAYQQIENLTIEPRISAKAMELNTGVAFLSVLAGAAILGPIGALLSLPLAATIKAFVGTYLQRTEVVASRLTADAGATELADLSDATDQADQAEETESP